ATPGASCRDVGDERLTRRRNGPPARRGGSHSESRLIGRPGLPGSGVGRQKDMCEIPAELKAKLDDRVREQVAAEVRGDVSTLYEFTLPRDPCQKNRGAWR